MLTLIGTSQNCDVLMRVLVNLRWSGLHISYKNESTSFLLFPEPSFPALMPFCYRSWRKLGTIDRQHILVEVEVGLYVENCVTILFNYDGKSVTTLLHKLKFSLSQRDVIEGLKGLETLNFLKCYLKLKRSITSSLRVEPLFFLPQFKELLLI